MLNKKYAYEDDEPVLTKKVKRVVKPKKEPKIIEEPEVYKMNNGSSASIISATLLSDAASTSGCNHWSRPAFMLTSELILFATKTFSLPTTQNKEFCNY